MHFSIATEGRSAAILKLAIFLLHRVVLILQICYIVIALRNTLSNHIHSKCHKKASTCGSSKTYFAAPRKMTNLDAKYIKRSLQMWATKFYKIFSKIFYFHELLTKKFAHCLKTLGRYFF